MYAEGDGEKWKQQVKKWRYCAAVACGKFARIVHAPSGKPVFQASLPDDVRVVILYRFSAFLVNGINPVSTGDISPDVGHGSLDMAPSLNLRSYQCASYY